MNSYDILLKHCLVKLNNQRRTTVTILSLKWVFHDFRCIANLYGLFDCFFFCQTTILSLLDGDQCYFVGSSVVFGNGEKSIPFNIFFESEEGEIIVFRVHIVKKLFGILPAVHLKLLSPQNKVHLLWSLSTLIKIISD